MNFRNPFAREKRSVSATIERIEPETEGKLSIPDFCSLFHITHWKAASQWFRAIFRDAFGTAVVEPEYHERQVWTREIEAGRVYPCVYLGKPEFDSLKMAAEARGFVLIRDLRDTLVSAYFSLRYSHETGTEEITSTRHWLNRLSLEEGLMYLAETWIPGPARIQNTWLNTDARVYRIEDFLGHEAAMLRKIFNEAWGVDLDAATAELLAERNSFARLSGGRQRGIEDTHSHYRKGTAGDWRSYFTPALARRFDLLYSDLLVSGGYEAAPGWSAEFA